jgi:hypothetical protein
VTPAPVPVEPARKKPFQIDPAVLAGIEKSLLQTDLKPAHDELHAALKEATNNSNSVTYALPYYQGKAKSCQEGHYSAEDQKKAGCSGSDTVSQCSNKLYWYCLMGGNNGGFPGKKMEMLKSADRLDKALKEYSTRLKTIPTR